MIDNLCGVIHNSINSLAKHTGLGGMAWVSGKNIDEICGYFDRLNQDASHYQSSNDICTPMGCVREMVDALPNELWARDDLKILDSCCGNGNFHAYIQSKAPLDALHFNEINEARLRNVEAAFGKNIRLTRHDFLSFAAVEKYDLVVSNPPYAKFCGDKRASKNHNLSRAFIHKAIEMTKPGGYVLFIVPDNWMSFSDRNVLPQLMSQYQFRRLNIHGAKKWFPKIGSSFTWFALQKIPNREAFVVENHYKRRDIVEARLDKGIDFIPLYYSDAVRQLVNRTIYSDAPKYRVETTSDLHRTTKADLLRPDRDRRHPYRLIHTPKQTIWSSRPHKFQHGWKVFISLSDRYGTTVDDCGMTQSIAFIRCCSKREAMRIKNELDNPLYRALNNLTRYGNFNNIRVLQRLPLLSHVKLTASDTALINHFAAAV